MTHITSEPNSPLDDLLRVANTRHGPSGHHRSRAGRGGPDHDHLAEPDEGRRYLADHGVDVPAGEPDRRSIERLAAIRELIRALAGDQDAAGGPLPEPQADDFAAAAGEARFRLATTGFEPIAEGWPGFVDRLLPTLLDVAADPTRLRACANPGCRFVFLDRSRNGSRRWCDSSACGNRVRVGRHRLKAAGRTIRIAGVSAPRRPRSRSGSSTPA